MTIAVRLALGFIGAAVPVLAMAAPPSVRNITAVNDNGRVRVSWEQVAGDIAAYRIFYSHESILGNNGLYDDFESADGSVTTHLLQTVPPVDELFVSVLAVDVSGDESPYFLEEARVRLNAGGVADSGSSTSSASSMSIISSASSASRGSAQTNDVLRLLNAQAISATGVLLTFSHPVDIPDAQAMDAVKIDAGSGRTLGLRRYIIQGNTVTVHTGPQERGRAYRVAIGTMVMGIAGSSTIPLAADQAPVLFMGHATGIDPMQPSQTSSAQSAPEVTQLRLRAQPQGTASYEVEATWQAPAGAFAAYSIAQTTDGGATYAAAQTVEAGITGIKVPGVPPGRFGMRVQVIGLDGTLSQGVTQLINLPALAEGSLPGSVVPMPGKGSLPSSGPALWVTIGTAGAMIGAWNLRRGRVARRA